MLKRNLLLTLLAVIFAIAPLSAQKSKIEEQKRLIAQLEQSIAKEEKELASLKKSRASTEKKIHSLARQIEQRTDLINATNGQIKHLNREIASSTRRVEELSKNLLTLEESCATMACVAYRNYRYNTLLAYILSASSTGEFARRLASLRTATEERNREMQKIVSLRSDVQQERDKLSAKRKELDAEKQKLARRRTELNKSLSSAKSEVGRLSKKEKAKLRSMDSHRTKLDAAIKELRALTKGNTSGAAFSTKTKGLKLPVSGGKVLQYKGNMAEISGAKGAKVTAIYEGKVVKVSRNKINHKYDIFIAHGEYISSYANLSSTSVKQGDVVQRNQQIGVVAQMIDPSTMQMQYKIVFGIYPPSSSVKMQASALFAK